VAAVRAPEGFGEEVATDSLDTLMLGLATELQHGQPEETVHYGWVKPPSGSEAVGWVHLPGLTDDSIAGEELRLHFEHAELGWFLDHTAAATHCRRAVDPGGRLCV
jgi:hypothetical protein